MSDLHPVAEKYRVVDWSKGEFDLNPASIDGYELWGYFPHMVPVLVATCGNAKALSDWALEKGADEIRWNFDLAIVERRERESWNKK